MPPRGPPKRLTHFFCIPLVTSTSRPQLQKSLDAFRTDTKDDRTPENPRGIPERAIRPVGTIHLTLGVMSLLTPERVDGALALLRSLDTSSLLSPPPAKVAAAAPDKSEKQMENSKHKTGEKQNPLQITLRGLNSMHDPAKTSILYTAPSLPSDQLYAFCNRLKDAFAEFLVQENRPLLLHATILNTVYVPGVRDRSGGQGAGHGKNKAKMTIDARGLLERYTEFVWMEDVRLEKLAICRMGARRVKDAEGRETGEEEYVVEGEAELPLV
jgi:activating signal cointegrator complex subunit 1